MSEPPFGALPSDVELLLVSGIGARLIRRYQPHFGDQSKFLAAAIINSAFLLPSGETEPVQRYLSEHGCLIEQQAQLIHLDPELADAFSLLYSFMLIRLGTNGPERSFALATRAGELRLWLRTPLEICNTSDATEFLAFVHDYATNLIGG